MKTREFVIPGFEAAVLLHHNDDWSGVAVIEWTDMSNQQHHVVKIPARILLQLSFQETKAWMLGEVGRALAKLQGGS